MTKEELENKLQDALNEKLKDTNYGDWGISGQIDSVIKPLLEPSVASKLWTRYDAKTHIASITYDRTTIAEIKVSTKKGQRHYSYFGSYNDWSIKSLTVTMRYDSFEDGIAAQDAYTLKQNAAEFDRKTELADKAKIIMKALNITDPYELFNLAGELKGYRYNDLFNAMLKQEN